jgi:hypothetical protein
MKKGREALWSGRGPFSLNQTSGRIATVWSRWKNGACRTVLRTAMVSTRANPKLWSSRRNCDQEVWLCIPPCGGNGSRELLIGFLVATLQANVRRSETLQDNSTSRKRIASGFFSVQTSCRSDRKPPLQGQNLFLWNFLHGDAGPDWACGDLGRIVQIASLKTSLLWHAS